MFYLAIVAVAWQHSKNFVRFVLSFLQQAQSAKNSIVIFRLRFETANSQLPPAAESSAMIQRFLPRYVRFVCV